MCLRDSVEFWAGPLHFMHLLCENLVFQINEEFRRCNTIPLESTFVSELDRYTPKFLELFSTKGGAVGQRMKSVLIELIQVSSRWSNNTRIMNNRLNVDLLIV